MYNVHTCTCIMYIHVYTCTKYRIYGSGPTFISNTEFQLRTSGAIEDLLEYFP